MLVGLGEKEGYEGIGQYARSGAYGHLKNHV